MNHVKKYLGYVWMLLAPVIVAFMIYQAYMKISNAADDIARTNMILQWVIILVIFIPICIGFFIFGKYASTGEYEE